MPSSPVFFRRTHWLRILLRFIIYLSASCAVCIPPNCSTPGSVCSWASCMSNACRWAGNLCNFWIHLCNFWIHFVTISWVFTPWKGSQQYHTYSKTGSTPNAGVHLTIQDFRLKSWTRQNQGTEPSKKGTNRQHKVTLLPQGNPGN